MKFFSKFILPYFESHFKLCLFKEILSYLQTDATLHVGQQLPTLLCPVCAELYTYIPLDLSNLQTAVLNSEQE